MKPNTQNPPAAEAEEEKKPATNKNKDSGNSPKETATWLLEDVYPNSLALLLPSKIVNASEANTLVVLDTNALLLPYKVEAQDLSKIEEVYKKLIAEGRLFIPSRAIREFIQNRDGRIAEITKNLRDRGSRVAEATGDIPPLLKSIPETNAVISAAEKLKIARKEYLNATDSLVQKIRSWRGDDPVTSIYHKLFANEIVVETDKKRSEIENEWAIRLQRKIPPGYKDASKPDTGIGDYLIWLVLIKLGNEHKKNMVFVTGEEKADWFVRMDGEGIYPRPELIDEYRRASEGHHLRLCKLADLLSDMHAPEETVKEVRQAEDFTNRNSWQPSISTGSASFDYSTQNGRIRIGSDPSAFELAFSKSSDDSIHFYRTSKNPYVARAKNISQGDAIKFEMFDSSSRVYTINCGEVFLAKILMDIF